MALFVPFRTAFSCGRYLPTEGRPQSSLTSSLVFPVINSANAQLDVCELQSPSGLPYSACKKTHAASGSTGECGAAAVGLLVVAAVAAVALGFVWYTFGSVVPPGHMGVRNIALEAPFGMGPKQGYSDEALEPGYHWQVPIYSEILTIPQTIQMLQLHRNVQQYSEAEPALEVQTLNGSSVMVDITILYRFFAEKSGAHGGPADLLKKVGREESWRPHLSVVANNELIKSLGSLSTADFYNPALRESGIETAREGMNQRLAEDGIFVEAVLLKRYTYQDDKIDDAIFDKNLQERQESFEKASSELTAVQAELRKVEKKWREDIKTLLVQGDSDVKVIRSEADLFETEKKAEGDLLVDSAEAEVSKLRAQALASSPGAATYIATEIAPMVGALKGGVVTEIDPFDLDGWVKKLGISSNKFESK